VNVFSFCSIVVADVVDIEFKLKREEERLYFMKLFVLVGSFFVGFFFVGILLSVCI
jgi:hypothetical protein